MIRSIAAVGLLALTVGACSGAGTAPPASPAGPFSPDVKLDSTQVEIVPPTVYVKVTPVECIKALDADLAYILADEAILAADDAVYTALADKNAPAMKRAIAKREAAITARNALDYDPASDLIFECRSRTER